MIGVVLNPLLSAGYAELYHFTPLHYLAFIARSSALFSKSELLKQGFEHSHFRAKSKKQDVERGFKEKAHLTTSSMPPILRAKLEAGFPHVGLRSESAKLTGKQFDLCRFNVAMTRRLRRGNHAGHKTGPENGEYYDEIQLPIARSDEEKLTLLAAARGKDRMVEVLVDGSFDLDESTTVIAFNERDAEKMADILRQVACPWVIELEKQNFYTPKPQHFQACTDFLALAVETPNWRGNGLEFDKV